MSEVKIESLFQGYIQAAFMAVHLRVSLAHAFNHYIKPDLPNGLPLLTLQERARWAQIQESMLDKPLSVPGID